MDAAALPSHLAVLLFIRMFPKFFFIYLLTRIGSNPCEAVVESIDVISTLFYQAFVRDNGYG